MKNKFLLGFLLVFVCGVLAVVIPKSVNAESTYISIPNEETSQDYPLLDIVNLPQGEYLVCEVLFDNSLWIRSSEIQLEIRGYSFIYSNVQGYLVIANIGLLCISYSYGNKITDFVVDSNGVFNTYLSKTNYLTDLAPSPYVYIDVYLTLGATGFSVTFDAYFGSDYEQSILSNSYFYGIPLEEAHSFYSYFTFSNILLYHNYLAVNGYVPKNVPVYISDSNGEFTDYLQSTTSSFLDTELFGTLSIGDILLLIVSIGLLLFALRFFSGG